MQLQETVTGLTPDCPEKVNMPFWQGMVSIEIEAVFPGVRVPLEGVNFTLLPRLLVAVQVTAPPCALRDRLQW